MTDERGASGGRVGAPVAVVFATVTFAALAIAGLGVTSLALDADVIATPGLGPIPGVVGMLLATAAFAGALWSGVRLPHPSFWTAAVCALAAWFGEAAGVGVAALGGGAEFSAAAAAVAGVAVGWPGAVLAAAALVSGWGGVALVRTRAGRPRWPWEADS